MILDGKLPPSPDVQIKRFVIFGRRSRSARRWWKEAAKRVGEAPKICRDLVEAKGDAFLDFNVDELGPMVDWIDAVPRPEGTDPPVTVLDQEHMKPGSEDLFKDVFAALARIKSDNRRKIMIKAFAQVQVGIQLWGEGDRWFARVQIEEDDMDIAEGEDPFLALVALLDQEARLIHGLAE